MDKPIITYYKDNKKFYDSIENKLDELNKRFLSADREKQRRILLDSYIFAVLSVQTPVGIHEEAFKAIKTGSEYEEAMKSVNYWKNKIKYIRETEVKFEDIDKAITLLERGKVSKAHKVLVDNFKGVGVVKSAFTLAMIGFKTRACIDSNVLNLSGLDRGDMYNGVVVEKYERFVSDLFIELSDKLYNKVPKFLMQWILFDYQRGERASHKVFFDYVGVEDEL